MVDEPEEKYSAPAVSSCTVGSGVNDVESCERDGGECPTVVEGP